jgi:hypothetical protein
MVDLAVLVNQHPVLGHRVRSNSRTALQAVTAARMCASGQAENVMVAAACTGSTPAHVRAAVILLKSEDEPLLDYALRGEISLLKAAKQARRVADLVNAYRSASRDDLITATRILGSIVVPDAAFGVAAE